MKIENTNIHYYPSSKWKKENEQSASEIKTPLKRQEDLSTLQQEAKEMASLMQQMQFVDVVREDKLTAVKEKMDAGVYQISGKDVVSKLMGER